MNVMKKYVLTILVAVILAIVGLLYYSYRGNETTSSNDGQSSVEAAPEKDIREIVWDQLSARQKEEVDGTWTDGEVSKTTISKNTAKNTNVDTSYIGEEIYVISFPSKLNPTVGDVVVFADMKTTAIIGYGLRD